MMLTPVEPRDTTFRDAMRADERGAKLLDEFEELSDQVQPVTIPPSSELEEILRGFEVPEEDIPEIIAARRLIEENEEVGWLLDRHVAVLRKQMGKVTSYNRFLDIPLEYGEIARFFYLYVYAAMRPFTLEYFRGRNIPEAIVDATLADIGRHVRVHYKNKGMSGVGSPWWLTLHLRGVIYQLGRLQFERVLLGERTGNAIREAGLPYGPEDMALSIHIPDFMGPFTPQAIDASIAQAKAFFPDYFPEQPIDIGVCYSWLLDDQLPDHLSPTSNIVQFHKRFNLIHQNEKNDSSAAIFIWGKPEIPDVPREGASSLERAIIAHHQAGGHWGGGAGWLRL